MSRLEESSRIIRENLISRNEYSSNDIYDINRPTSIEVINGISRLVRPGNAFDFSNTVIGRIVGPQTPITQIANQALINQYTEQVKSIIVRKNTPKINLNSLFNKTDNEGLFVKNIDYTITKERSDNIIENIFNVLKDYSGVNSLKNPITQSTEGISSNYDKPWIYNTTSTSESLIKEFTGKGQLDHLKLLLSNNIYYNNFSKSNNQKLIDNDNSKLINTIALDKSIGTFSNISNEQLSYDSFNLQIQTDFNETILSTYYKKKYTDNQYYGTVDNVKKYDRKSLQDNYGISYNVDRLSKTTDEDIVTLNNNTGNTFTWGTTGNATIETSISNSIGLLGYTNALFKTFKDSKNPLTFDKSVNSITVDGITYYNGIKHPNRSYSNTNQMDSIGKTINPNGNKLKNSVIEGRPTPKVIYEGIATGQTNNSMFTIENLAFLDTDIESLGNVGELGPNGGRIMWFSPNIFDFSENVSPNINSINFLGRGEPVYTYANTERKLTINFMLMTDYTQNLIGVNSLTEFQNRIYIPINTTNNNNRNSAKTNRIVNNNDQKLKQQQDIENSKNKLNKLTIPFDTSNILPIEYYYNNGDFVMIPTLNPNFSDKLNSLYSKIEEYANLNDTSKFEININGSMFDTVDNSTQLYKRRSENFKETIELQYQTQFPKLIGKITINILPINNTDNPINGVVSPNSDDTIKKRKMSIISANVIGDGETFEVTRNDIPQSVNTDLDSENETINDLSEVTVFASRGITDDITLDNSISGTFNKIKKGLLQNGLITYTPYDLYKRLTFLHQCTRQGITPTKENISNSVFGRPPIIIFKLGDMYNTKAIITSLDFQFEQEVPWDINPDGFGVQKMGCKVSISMNLIGAATINGPKPHILNGASKRFYANSSFEASNDDIIDIEER